MKFATLYDEGMEPSPGIVFTEPSMADQSQFQESDINYIVRKYADGRTGITTLDLGADAGVLQYGDTLLPGDYETALDLINAVNEEFYELPSQVRAEFNHNPKELINALADPRQKVRLQSLGLLRENTSEAAPAESTRSENSSTPSKKQNETQTNEST
nr:MAG TPA: Scaffold protein [Microviridae sp.]